MGVNLNVSEVRAIVLHAQLLNNAARITPGKKGVYEIIDHLGYVQLDTLSVIQRAHHHTLRNRHQQYEPGMLHELQKKDKLIFEYWGHAAFDEFLPSFANTLSDFMKFNKCEEVLIDSIRPGKLFKSLKV